MRLAYYSPLPPQRSGIADYSAELLPHLAAHCEIELIVDEGVRPAAELAARFPVNGHKALAGLLAAGRFDAVLYQLGNNRDYHASIYRTLIDHPGVVVLHEYVIHHLVRDLTLFAGDPEAYVREMRYAYGRTGEAMARRCVATGVPLDPWSYPLFERAVDASLGVIVHNHATRDRVLASRPLARIATIPHHLSLEGLPEIPEAAARAELGIAPGEIVVATFGFLTASKRPEVLLRAFARLRQEVPNARLLIVGEVSPHFDFARILTPGLRAGVTVTGRLEIDRFLLYMRACDVAVNLRHPTAGETSGTVVRLLGMGKPLIVNETGSFAEIPDDCCAKVPLDDTEEDLLLAYLRLLAGDEPLRRRMGENARRHMELHHSLAGSARAYADFLRQTVESGARPFRAVPPLEAYPEDDLLSDLVRETSAEMVDLGVEEGEEDLLREVAAAIVEVDLDR
ncbi:MAG TPA: glycosyltransferase family 4 protein [Thermoanaerobaculia bacterium]|nr:glycosyltransferase family 4 protein [Thermoanaerobaculia bacterium]